PGQRGEVRRDADLRAPPLLVERLDDGPGDGEPVEGRGTPPDLVEEHEAPRRDVVEDRGGLDHLDQERALAAGEVVLGADAREDPVDHADPRFARGQDRKSTRLNSSHVAISYAVFCLKKKKKK